MKGRILSTIGGTYHVLCDGRVFTCTPRGVFRHQKKSLLVGDWVTIDENESTITGIEERKNSLIRPRIANLDYGVVVLSLANPDFSSFLLDKFLSLLDMSEVPPMIVLTKYDLLEDKSIASRAKEYYESLGIPVFIYSKRTLEGVEDIKKAIRGKVIAFMGQTGVGKSSLINVLDPDFEREIGEYSIGQGRGKHQTKEVIFLPYENGLIADTPGFSSLELPLYKEDLAKFFPGFSPYIGKCRYGNCMHLSEPGCQVKEAMKEGKISGESYHNYEAFLEELIFRKDRYQ